MPAMIQMNKREIRSMVSSYKKGASLRDLANHWGVSVPTVRRLLLEGGAEIRPQGRPRSK